jgi:ketosteroid isomerase-like protein
MSQDVVFDGGSDADRAAVLEALHAYLRANATFDWKALAGIWSHDAKSVFFNMNGHTYVGLPHWTRLWQYYHDRLETGLWEPYDINVLIRGDMALVTCHRKTRRRWKGAESERLPNDVDKPAYVSRSTMVMLKESGGWRTVHVHFSEANAGPRPGGI